MQIKLDYQKYLKSDYWKQIREQIYKRDGYKCRLCNSAENLQVHHRTYEHLGDEKLEELITLCRKCHNVFHKKNPEINYTTYSNHKKWEEEQRQEEKEIIDIWFYLSDNRDKFDELKLRLYNEGYIKSNEFHKTIKKLNTKKFDNILFINICLEYINGIPLFSCKPEIKKKLNLPRVCAGLIIDRNTYEKYPEEFNRTQYGKL